MVKLASDMRPHKPIVIPQQPIVLKIHLPSWFWSDVLSAETYRSSTVELSGSSPLLAYLTNFLRERLGLYSTIEKRGTNNSDDYKLTANAHLMIEWRNDNPHYLKSRLPLRAPLRPRAWDELLILPAKVAGCSHLSIHSILQ
ncbi:hypothetical protein BDQ94DRAFT_29533 [Aspergillus welwitschiae]|uniref:Uncharacterized protein n=1 Tax=Aspergillus welwitschiae TaxID=1341132 RepID=A0A3F3Q2M8_9EURO|nr:hypothetical protein BDQ94DRAFT_29533 [Aspergillus welwitschiae]RDH33438.1 hypothetical protein BDQ94DRAFT_29533 [Aspergillus welwitschiae]